MGGEIVVQLSADGEVLSAAGEVLPSAAGPRPSAPDRRHTRARHRRRDGWPARAGRRAGRQCARPRRAWASTTRASWTTRSLADAGTRLVWRIDARLPAGGSKPARAPARARRCPRRQVLTSISRIHSAEGPNRRVCDNRNVPGQAVGLQLALHAHRGPAGYRHRRRRRGVPADGRDLRLLLRSLRARRHRRQGLAHEGHRALLPGLRLSLAQRRVEVGPAAGHLRQGLGQGRRRGRPTSSPTACSTPRRRSSITTSRAPSTSPTPTSSASSSTSPTRAAGTPAGPRWKIGEDTPIGVFRDMRDPTRYGHPDRVRSPKWHTGTSDDGGVHRNSGVGNKAAYLMADGGTFRGYAIKAHRPHPHRARLVPGADHAADAGRQLHRPGRRAGGGLHRPGRASRA